VPSVFLIQKEIITLNVNNALYMADDAARTNQVMGSHLIPMAAYHDPNAPATVAKVYEDLLDGDAMQILGNLVAGGQVSANAGISSAVHLAWRTAKTHIIVVNPWDDSASVAEIDAVRKEFQTNQVTILERLSGPNAGSYSNEVDALEPNFQTTFFRPNYAKLSPIKCKYDPHDLFIVAAGVESERWDESGMCTV